MRCPRCGHEQADELTECAGCGIIFAKLLARRERTPQLMRDEDPTATLTPAGQIRDLLFGVRHEVNPFVLAGKALLLVILAVWGFKLSLAPITENAVGESFLHLVNLPFHEAGHILFALFGSFMAVLGGSLLQVLIPLICLGSFLIKMRDPYAAAVMLWWTGESCLDLAPYINDARALELTLIGGVTGRDNPDMHDWANILERLGLLEYDHLLAAMAKGCGILLLLTACAWGGYVIGKEWRMLRSGKFPRGGVSCG